MTKRSIFTLLVGLTTLFSVNAQIDVSVNPLGILFGTYGASVEKGFSENFGVELTADYSAIKYDLGADDVSSNGFGARIMGKYYFGPDKGIDKFNVAVYFRYGSNTFNNLSDVEVSNTRVAAGLYIGYKTVANSGLFFEIGLGGGKAFTNSYKEDGVEVIDGGDYPVLNIDLTGKLAIGYRF